jgi:hypothetical protein
MQAVHFNLVINVLQLSTFLELLYFLNKRRTKYVSIFLDENLTPQVKTVSSSRSVVLNQMQWFTLVIFKKDIPKSKVDELGDSHHTVSVYCGLYIRITSEDVTVFLSKFEWSYLMEFAGSGTDRQILKLCRLPYDHMQW